MAAAIIGGAGLAVAEEAYGTVESVDLQSRMILLDDGNVYSVGEEVALEALRPGSEVTVSHDEKDGQKVVTEIIAER